MTKPNLFETVYEKLENDFQNSQTLPVAQFLKTLDIQTMGRPLTKEEIQTLKSQGNTSNNWDLIRVEDSFSPQKVWQSHFSGNIYMPQFSGTICISEGIELETGIYSSFIQNSVMGNVCLRNVSLLANYCLDDQVCILNSGSITWSTCFLPMFGKRIYPGSETKTRCFWTTEFTSIESAFYSTQLNGEEQKKVQEKLIPYTQELELPMGYIGRQSQIENTPKIQNSWMGSFLKINGAQSIKNSFLSGIPEGEDEQNNTSIIIENGSVIRDSFVQTNSHLEGPNHIENSYLCSYSKIGPMASISQSIIAGHTSIEKAEVISSLVGPLVGLHHQSLLISALWPDGRGNIGHGAKVGSNHTGRKPDQEIVPGEGSFFGLGCNIKFPCNLQKSPYSIIAAGVTLPPQKISCPFSLITTSINSSKNEIFPGWVWYDNPYSLFRSIYKIQDREKSNLSTEELLFPDSFGQWALETLQALESTENTIEIGSNILSQKSVQKAIRSYKSYLIHWLWCQNEEKTQNDVFISIQKYLCGKTSLNTFLRKNRGLLADLVSRIERSFQKDFKRGEEVFNDYSTFHSIEDPILTRASQDVHRWIRKDL